MCRWVREEGRRSRKENGRQAVGRSGGQAVRRSGGQAVRRSGGPIVVSEAKKPSLQASENSRALFLLSCRQASRQQVGLYPGRRRHEVEAARIDARPYFGSNSS